MRHVVFCHGFAFSPQYWCNLAPYFAHFKVSTLDLGYFGIAHTDIEIANEDQLILIGHSLGFLKILQLYGQHPALHAVIGLNSFMNFLGTEKEMKKKRSLELLALRRAFKQDIARALQAFYARCGINNMTIDADAANLASLLGDLDLLAEPASLPLPKKPCLMLYNEDDVVVPQRLIISDFNGKNVALKQVNSSGHALGYKFASQIYDEIMNFLDDSVAAQSKS